MLEEPRGQGWQSVIREQCRGDEASCQGLVRSVRGRQVVTKERLSGDSHAMAVGSAKVAQTAVCSKQSQGQLGG